MSRPASGAESRSSLGAAVPSPAFAFLLTLIPTDLIFLNIDPNYGQVIQGTLIVLVVMVGGLVAVLKSRR